MASDESVTIQSSSMQEEDDDEYDINIDDGFDHQPHPHNLSRLSMCTSNSTVYGDYDDDDASYFHVDGGDNSDGAGHSIRTFMSRLSIESFHCDDDGDVEEEISDEKEGKEISGGFSSDSDKEPRLGCYSLPATPPRQRNRSGDLDQQQQQLKGLLLKGYASENEAQKMRRKNTLLRIRSRSRRRRRRRRTIRERWLEGQTTMGDHSDYHKKMVNKEDQSDEEDMMINKDMGGGGGNDYDYNYNYNSNCGNSISGGESEGGGVGGGLVVITRAKGGRRSLCMALEEVKACRDLGFELEHESTSLELMSSTTTATRLSISGSTLDTASSGGNSPIANWRISSPGDDPRDVKARLKLWAQAVALASTSRHGC